MSKHREADSLVSLLEDVDTRMHGLAAREVAQGRKPRMSLKKWEGMFHELLRFVGTPKAKKLIEATKD